MAAELPDVPLRSDVERHRNQRILLAAIWALVVRGGSFIVTIVTIPVAVEALGSERFGAWITITGTLSLLGFLDGGMSNAVINLVAHFNAEQNERAIRQVVSTAFWTLAGIAVVGIGVSAFVIRWVDWQWLLNLSGNLEATEIRSAVFLAAAFFFVNFAASVVQRIRRGLQESHRNEYFEAFGVGIKLASVLAAGWMGLSLVGFIAAFSIGTLLASIANCISLFAWERKSIRPRLDALSGETLRALMGTGLLFLGLQICVAVAFQTDALIVSRFHGLDAAAELGLGMRLFGLSTTLAAMITAPLWPAFRDACSRKDQAWIRGTFVRVLIGTVVCSVLLTGAIYWFRSPLLRAWTGNEVMPSDAMLLAIFLWSNLAAAGGVLAMLLNGLQVVRLQLVFSFAMTCLNLILSVAFVRWIGPEGVVVGSIAAYLLCILLPYSIVIPKLLRDANRSMLAVGTPV